MKNIKSHFWYNKRQRNGILYLCSLIVIIQLIFHLADFSSDEIVDLNTSELIAFQTEIDSLKLIQLEKRSPEIFPFNPSFITDYKGYKLGMSTSEIDQLLTFREKGNYINSAKQFQEVTKVNDSLFNLLKPFFKFPKWLNKTNGNSFIKKKLISKDLNLVTKEDLQLINGVGKVLSSRIIKYRNSLNGFSNNEQLKNVYGLKTVVISEILKYYKVNHLNISSSKKRKIEVRDLNKVTSEELKVVNGIGDKLSVRIIKFRTSLGGFLFKDQLNEVYGLKGEVIEDLFNHFQLLSKPKIKKLNINEATFKEILKLSYIDYELTKKIFEYKNEFAEIQNLKELKKIDGFPIDKYERIVLYLTVDY